MKRVGVDEIADELYGLAPEEFTQARDEAARDAGDPAVRKAVKALRRPTVSAHAVNRLARERSDTLDELLALGDELRAAMTGQGGDVRHLTERRRELVSDLVEADLPAGVRDDVSATLEAATADPELGAAVRSGRLVKPLRYAGFGALPDLGDALATPLATPLAPGERKPAKKQPATKAPKKAAPAKSPRKLAAVPDVSQARERVLDLAGAADDAQRRYDAAARAATQARALLERAEAERAEAHRQARAAHAEAERARRELGRLERS
jgi:hypothetical protein